MRAITDYSTQPVLVTVTDRHGLRGLLLHPPCLELSLAWLPIPRALDRHILLFWVGHGLSLLHPQSSQRSNQPSKQKIDGALDRFLLFSALLFFYFLGFQALSLSWNGRFEVKRFSICRSIGSPELCCSCLYYPDVNVLLNVVQYFRSYPFFP
ncbi:hypothetical protein K1719_011826 [Acacia pycnantha]|nr:hypothetical protein K1719_011826 [Acacia pycnantha]